MSQKQDLIAIVAVDANWGIGSNNDLLFSLPTDMKFFRQSTLGHTVVMGRKTLDSFPGGKPLPKRRNVVLTHQDSLPQEVEIVHTVADLLQSVAQETAFVIGGGTVYEALLPHCTKAYVTRVQSVGVDVDTHFPNLEALPHWQVVDESAPITENGHTFTFVTYQQTKN